MTALLKVFNDLLLSLDKRLLSLLDLSAAFDHGLLFQRLNHDFGISGTVLDWLRSYLGGRSQSVVDGHISDPIQSSCGVPQGSVSGLSPCSLAHSRERLPNSQSTYTQIQR